MTLRNFTSWQELDTQKVATRQTRTVKFASLLYASATGEAQAMNDLTNSEKETTSLASHNVNLESLFVRYKPDMTNGSLTEQNYNTTTTLNQ